MTVDGMRLGHRDPFGNISSNVLQESNIRCIMVHLHNEGHMKNLAQDCSNSSALAMELLQSCAKPSISHLPMFCWKDWTVVYTIYVLRISWMYSSSIPNKLGSITVYASEAPIIYSEGILNLGIFQSSNHSSQLEWTLGTIIITILGYCLKHTHIKYNLFFSLKNSVQDDASFHT